MTASKFVEAAPVVPPAAIVPAARVGGEFVRYFACSAAALAVDAGLFALGLQLGFGWAAAAAVGFLAGLAVAYTLSVRFVFRERRLQDARAEFLAFTAIGLAGLLLTELLLWALIDHAHWSAGLAKFATAGAVFCFNFGVRKALLFTRPRR